MKIRKRKSQMNTSMTTNNNLNMIPKMILAYMFEVNTSVLENKSVFA